MMLAPTRAGHNEINDLFVDGLPGHNEINDFFVDGLPGHHEFNDFFVDGLHISGIDVINRAAELSSWAGQVGGAIDVMRKRGGGILPRINDFKMFKSVSIGFDSDDWFCATVQQHAPRLIQAHASSARLGP